MNVSGSRCTWFHKAGPSQTEATLSLAAKRAAECNIPKVIVASSSGATALVVVTHSMGFEREDVQEMEPKTRKALEDLGCAVLTCQHAFGGVNRAVRRTLHTYQLDEIIAYTLRTMGQGFKVCIETAVMAADAGLVSVKKEVLCIAGTGTGADTAIVLTPANAQNFFKLKVHEIVCKPRL
jgi:hypothetical protein